MPVPALKTRPVQDDKEDQPQYAQMQVPPRPGPQLVTVPTAQGVPQMPPSAPQQSDAPMQTTIPMPQTQDNAPTVTQPTAAASPLTAPIKPHMNAELARLTTHSGTDPVTGKYDRSKDESLSGIGKIKSPWARIPLQIAEAVGGSFFPNIDAMLPGTQLHHQVLVNQAAGQQEREIEADKEASEEGERQSRAAHEAAQAEAVNHPKPERVTNEFEKWIHDNPQGTSQDWEDFKAKNLKAAGMNTPFEKWQKDNPNATVEDWFKLESANKPTATREGEMPLGERVGQLNQMLAARYQVLHPGQPLPAQYSVPGNATQKDYDRIDKGLESEERAQGTKTQQDQLNEMRKQTAAIAAGQREHKNEQETRQAGLKAFTPALDSAERFNVMAKNYEDAVKNHDQQAMLSLLANHLGMTMGLQKGARMTKDIIDEAKQSRPWLQGLQAKFDKDGYLSGVNLTPDQMRQMVHLGRDRFSEDISKGRNEAHYMGANNEGPERTPNKATINFYVAQSGGDLKKAKEMAAADGWTVK